MTEIIIPDSVYSGILGNASSISSNTNVNEKSLIDSWWEKDSYKFDDLSPYMEDSTND